MEKVRNSFPLAFGSRLIGFFFLLALTFCLSHRRFRVSDDLATYCTNEGIRHILFSDFSNALPIVEAIVNGKHTVEEVFTAGGLPAPSAPLA